MRLRIASEGTTRGARGLSENLAWDVQVALRRDVITWALLAFSRHVSDLKHTPSTQCPPDRRD